MTFQHGGHACAGGIAGVLGAFGIHLPEHDGSTLQDRINEHHERVTPHVNDARDHVNNTINASATPSTTPSVVVAVFGWSS
jgi:hypothetical protein